MLFVNGEYLFTFVMWADLVKKEAGLSWLEVQRCYKNIVMSRHQVIFVILKKNWEVLAKKESV